MHSSRVAQDAPPFQMPNPHRAHHRALLWDTVYCDLSVTQSLSWLNLRALSNTLHAVPFDPREPPPAMRKRVNADVSLDLKRTGTRGKTKGIKFAFNNLLH